MDKMAFKRSKRPVEKKKRLKNIRKYKTYKTFPERIKYTKLKNKLRDLITNKIVFPFGETLLLVELARYSDKADVFSKKKPVIPFCSTYKNNLSPHSGWNFEFIMTGKYREKYLDKVGDAFKKLLDLREKMIDNFIREIRKYDHFRKLLDAGEFDRLEEELRLVMLCKYEKDCNKDYLLEGRRYKKIREDYDKIIRMINIDMGELFIILEYMAYAGLVKHPEKVRIKPSKKALLLTFIFRGGLAPVLEYAYKVNLQHKNRISKFSLNKDRIRQSIHLGIFDFNWIRAVLSNYHLIKNEKFRKEITGYFSDLVSVFGIKILPQFTRSIEHLGYGYMVAFPFHTSDLFYRTDLFLFHITSIERKKHYFVLSNFEPIKEDSELKKYHLAYSAEFPISSSTDKFIPGIKLIFRDVLGRVRELYSFLDSANVDIIRTLKSCGSVCVSERDGERNVFLSQFSKFIPDNAINPDGTINIERLEGGFYKSKVETLRLAFKSILTFLDTARLTFVEKYAIILYLAKKMGIYVEYVIS